MGGRGKPLPDSKPVLCSRDRWSVGGEVIFSKYACPSGLLVAGLVARDSGHSASPATLTFPRPRFLNRSYKYPPPVLCLSCSLCLECLLPQLCQAHSSLSSSILASFTKLSRHQPEMPTLSPRGFDSTSPGTSCLAHL